MASMRDIKARIKGVKSTGQITKAMKLVSSVKLQREREKFEKNRIYVEKMKEAIGAIAEISKEINNIYLKNPTETRRTAYIILTSDRGLSGAYNINVTKELMRARDESREEIFFAVGKKAKAFLTKNKIPVEESYFGITEEPHYDDALNVGGKVIKMYEKGEIDEVKIIYTTFHSIIHQETITFNLLPVMPEKFETNENKRNTAMRFEPSPEVVLEYLMPKYFYSILYGALIEASVCEEASRMTAMENATKNANELIDNLTLKYNRARQAAITKEITEIVGGANALQ